MRLLDIILALSNENRGDLSCISIDRNASGQWVARLSIARMQAAGEHETDDLPAGVTVAALERVPDQEYELDLDDLNLNASVRAQALALQEAGLVGRLDLARYDRADRTTGYKIKTHAGSQAERNAWLMRKPHWSL